MRFTLWCVLLAAVLLAWEGGCAKNTGDAFRPEVVVGDQAAVYIYRLKGSGGSVRIALDGADIGDLRPGEYIVRTVKPGEHVVRAEASSSVARTVEAMPGEGAFAEITTGSFGLHPTITTPGEEVARSRIAGTVRVSGP